MTTGKGEGIGEKKKTLKIERREKEEKTGGVGLPKGGPEKCLIRTVKTEGMPGSERKNFLPKNEKQQGGEKGRFLPGGGPMVNGTFF